MTKKHRLLIGAHMPVTGGYYKALERGKSISCSTIQLFTKSNRQWYAKPITADEIELFKRTQKETDIEPVVAHASYLINCGSPDASTREKSIKALIDEVERCSLLSIPYLVVHPGSRLESSEQECLDHITQSLNYVFKNSSSGVMILLENMAGQGSSICSSFEQLGIIIKGLTDKKRVGVCFDTCHAFAAGYDLHTEREYEAVWKEFDTQIGLEYLKVIHVNDSKKDIGSRVDRHEDIGKGKLGLESFKLLFNDPRFFDIPKILETPKESLDDDARNLNTLRSLLSDETKEKLAIK